MRYGPRMTAPAETFQELILRLQTFWADQGCLVAQPFDVEKGAGTYSPHTFLRALGPAPWRVAYVEPSRRPTDGRYGANPNRLYRHHQFQVLLKPSPDRMQELYLQSLRAVGIDPLDHDVRFVEDNWESPTLGAWGLGWEVWVDGMELTQFTYFQQCGGLECRPVSGELTYGLERIAMYLQGVDDVYDLAYAPGIRYREVFHQDEVQYSKFAFEALDVARYHRMYDDNEKECQRLVEEHLVIPAYDHLLRAAHAFNSLDANGAISVTERQGYILRIRDLAKLCAEGYLGLREQLGFPLGRADAPPEATPPKARRFSLSNEPRARDFFFELGVEELPAGEVMGATHALASALTGALDDARLSHGDARVFATPRRIAVTIADVADRQEDRTLEVSGPPEQAAFRDGRPTKAAEGFARSQGVDVESLEVRETDKGRYVYCVVREEGRAAAEILTQAIEAALPALPFSRTMRWGAYEPSFSRPVSWMVALFGEEVLPARFGPVVADRVSRGHRFMDPRPFEVTGVEQWLNELRERFVAPDPEQRRAQILEACRARAAEAGGELVARADLVDEVTQLVEWPIPLLGAFDERFLEVPREVLESEMEHHQRYFPITGADGRLLPNFVVVANTQVKDTDVSLAGYRRVLTARFEDGAFFFAEDQKRPLFDRVPMLQTVRFHRDLGSVHDKVERVSALALWLAGALRTQIPELEGEEVVAPGELMSFASGPMPDAAERRFAWSVARAAFLAKADLTTQMVFEFPELQGVMGRTYAAREGESPAIAAAIEEHYRPRFAGDAPPSGVIGGLVGLADRLDSICGIFGIGKGPTGGADPFGLRRAAVGSASILRAFDWRLSLSSAVAESLRLLGDKVKTDAVEEQIEAFFRGRLKASLSADGVPGDVVEAAFSVGFDEMVDAELRAQALAEAEHGGADFEAAAVTFKRVSNILKKAGDEAEGDVDPALFESEAERVLFASVQGVSARVQDARDRGSYVEALSELGTLRPAVDAFFDEVMVLADDEALRRNRVRLLRATHAIFAPIADLAQLS